MNDLPLGLYSTHDIKMLERLAIKSQIITPYQLMCQAGQSAFNLLEKYWPQVKSITVMTGLGNNAGDGFVLARLAKSNGFQVKLYQVGEVDESRLSLEAKQARAEWENVHGETTVFHKQDLEGEVIIDALLGTGARFPLSHALHQAIGAINQSKKPVLAIDLPSGLNADTGLFEEAVKASITLTFIGLKIGLFCHQAVEIVGEIFFDNLQVPADIYKQVQPKATRLAYHTLLSALRPRPLSSHKGDYGHVLIIGGGQPGYSGAVCLAGQAALRSGAGLVSAVVAPESLPLLARAPAELMSYGLGRSKELAPLIEKATVMVLGCGLSQTKWGEEFFHAAMKTTKPLVVDADGLTWLAKHWQKRDDWILTPHPGEAARLLGVTIEEVQENRMQAALMLHEKYGAIIVLKGSGTIIVNQKREIFIQPGGMPALATGGTGDVLAGLIGGLIAQRNTLSVAAQIAVNVHALAALKMQSKGTRGMIASDLFSPIRTLLNPMEPL